MAGRERNTKRFPRSVSLLDFSRSLNGCERIVTGREDFIFETNILAVFDGLGFRVYGNVYGLGPNNVFNEMLLTLRFQR